MRIRTIDTWLSGVVLAHLLITFAHGAAHRSAQVGLGVAGMLFVLIVIEVAPLVGLAVALSGRRIGGWIVASSMAAALMFGLINHFLVGGPDHVSSVAAESRALFTS